MTVAPTPSPYTSAITNISSSWESPTAASSAAPKPTHQERIHHVDAALQQIAPDDGECEGQDGAGGSPADRLSR